MLSRKFSAPKAHDADQWRKVQLLVDHGFRFQSIREQASGLIVAYPATVADAKLFVERYACQVRSG